MRKLIIVFMFYPFFLKSQTYFNERYNIGAQNALNVAANILFNEDDKIIMSDFVTTDEYLHYRVGMLVISEQGAKENEKIVSDSVWGYVSNGFDGGFRRFSSSSFMAVGLKNRFTDFTVSKGNIFKFDNNLDTLYNISFGDTYPHDTNYFFRHMDFTLDSSLVVFGYTIKNGESSDALLIKVDSLGNELWRSYYNSGSFNMGINVLSLPDSGYALSCFKWQFQSTVSHNYLIRTDSLGNELWRRYIGGPLDDGPLFLAWSATDSTIVGAYHTADSAITNADSYNRLALIKVDVDNNLVYDKKFMQEKDYDQYNFMVNGITIDSMNNIIVVGTTREPWPASAGYLFKFSNEGDSIWYRQYQKSYSYYADNVLNGVTIGNDGGYAAVGYFTPYPPDTGNQDVWVIKVDSMGCISEGDCWVGNREIMALQGKGVLKIYPNPSSGRINIEVPQSEGKEDFVFTIWDLYGRKVDEVTIPEGQSEIVLDISSYPPGLYNIVGGAGGSLKVKGKFIKR